MATVCCAHGKIQGVYGGDWDRNTHLQECKPLVSKSGNRMDNEGDAQEDQIKLIRLKVRSDANTGLLLEDIQALNKEASRSKVDREGDRDVPSHEGPAADPGGNTTTPVRRQGKSLIVHTTSSGIHRRDLSQGRGNTQHDERHQDPAPNHVRGAATDHRIRHGGRQTVRHGGQDEAHKDNLQRRPVARQFGHVSEVLQAGVRRRCCFGHAGLRDVAGVA